MPEYSKSKNTSCVFPAKVTVVIPVYNAEKWIINCIDSVLNQTLPPSEIVVVNDGSTDKTVEILEQKYALVPGLKVVHQSNKGPSAARNRGISESTKPFVAFLDADDIWLPQKLSRQMHLLESAGKEYGLCHTFFEVIDEYGKVKETWEVLNRWGDYYGNFDEITSKHLACCNYVAGSGSSVLLRTECIKDIGLFDEDIVMGEDWNYWYRLSLRYRILTVPEVLVQIRRHKYSAQNRKKFMLKEGLINIKKLKEICLPEHRNIFRKTEQRTVAVLLLFSLTDVSLVLELFKEYGLSLILTSLVKIASHARRKLCYSHIRGYCYKLFKLLKAFKG